MRRALNTLMALCALAALGCMDFTQRDWGLDDDPRDGGALSAPDGWRLRDGWGVPDAWIIDAWAPPPRDARPPRPDAQRRDAWIPPDAIIPPESCEEDAKLIYLVDSSARMYAFNPPDRRFEIIGDVNCPGGGWPHSMSVTRAGIAYVLYMDPGGGCLGIYAVRVADAACLGRTEFRCGDGGLEVFGMGFASDGPGASTESLYIGDSFSSSDGEGLLARVDTVTWDVEVIGDIPGAPEMSGTGDGALWGFFAWNDPPMVARLDKGTARASDIVEFPELGAESSSFAFAHWGGDFYLFHGPGGRTVVYRVRGGSDELEFFMDTGGLNIVGAGVSTCAPTLSDE